GGGQLLQSPLEHPTDQGGVARHMHRWAPGTSGKRTLYRPRPEKPGVRRKISARGEAKRLNSGSTLDLRHRQGATNLPISQSWPGRAASTIAAPGWRGGGGRGRRFGPEAPPRGLPGRGIQDDDAASLAEGQAGAVAQPVADAPRLDLKGPGQGPDPGRLVAA